MRARNDHNIPSSHQINGGRTITARTDFLGLATTSTSSPSFTPLMYPMPIPVLPKLGAGAPELSLPIFTPCKSLTSLPGLG